MCRTSAQLMRMVAEMTAVKIAAEYFMVIMYISFVGWMMKCVTRSVCLYLYDIASNHVTGHCIYIKEGNKLSYKWVDEGVYLAKLYGLINPI